MDCDIVILGAGSAGCVLAARLSEDPGTRVLLLEAGPEDRSLWLKIPIGHAKTIRNPRYNWMYETEPEESSGNRRLGIPRGRVLGGSSAINGHGYTRGDPADYDAWAQMGNRGWSYDDVLPYFRKMERFEGGADEFRGGDGPLGVSRAPDRHEICEAFLAAAGNHGIPLNADQNGARQDGINYFQRSISRGLRESTARTFLAPARSRPNLEVITDARVLRLTFEGKRCTGLVYEIAGETRSVRASREVFVALGAVASPQLLEVSGIGAAGRLKDLGVTPVHHLPGVGENLQDHYLARLAWRVTRPVTFNERRRGWRLVLEALKYATTRRGLLSVCSAQLVAFTRSRPELDATDLELTMTPWSFDGGRIGELEREPGMSMAVWPLRPESRGSIHARSADMRAAPAIRPNYLSEEADRRMTVDGLRLARRLMASPELDTYRGVETVPGAGVDSDRDLLEYAKTTGLSVGHLVGTCKMGPEGDANAVVDPDLRVHGIEALRVVDGSVMPALVSAHTNAPIVMMAEKASDLIRGAIPAAGR